MDLWCCAELNVRVTHVSYLGSGGRQLSLAAANNLGRRVSVSVVLISGRRVVITIDIISGRRITILEI